ncbi:MAG: hypothetical protein HOE35_04155 [Candidatus Ruthia sp.]|jgi:hypothetical protein|nr:hypothetical protein [Candidatus Ruthturnera sp.]MBT4123107.1 hypothetical protein [Candidatus Ruthturnera sp.]MBT4668779.1 hypothetical protein [Candidatus Ruthturnera sp.]MBT6922462.1 hypothetical protein [Candidatus Ruthturnera sp.]
MKKLFVATLFLASFNAQAFLDFNSYGSGYDDNDWPVWTPMFWMEKVTDNNMFSNNNNNKRNQGYGYPYNNRPYNVNASRFDMSQMPTPDQAYQAESNRMPHPTPMFMTPAAQSFTNSGNTGNMPSMGDLPSPYPANYQFNQPPNPYPSGF